MGLFRSRGRGDRTPKGAAREVKSKGSGDAPDQDRSQSCKTTPVTRSGPDGTMIEGGDHRSAERESTSGQHARTQGGSFMATIGQSIVFKGELTGDEDLEIEGEVEGEVNLRNHQLTIGANGCLKAEVTAKSIIVIGQVTGNLVATERIEVQATGVVEGDVKAPRLNVQEGAVLNGSIDMSPSTVSEAKKTLSAASTSATATASSTSAATAANGSGSSAGEALKTA